MEICELSKKEYPELIEIWEASVRATHDFLPDAEINTLKPLILAHYFDAVSLRGVTRHGKLAGFIGVADANIEMLFIQPEYFGMGMGKALVRYACDHLAATKVDVNEQNPQAIAFYRRLGFQQVGRSELDGQGNPYPLLHMALREQ